MHFPSEKCWFQEAMASLNDSFISEWKMVTWEFTICPIRHRTWKFPFKRQKRSRWVRRVSKTMRYFAAHFYLTFCLQLQLCCGCRESWPIREIWTWSTHDVNCTCKHTTYKQIQRPTALFQPAFFFSCFWSILAAFIVLALVSDTCVRKCAVWQNFYVFSSQDDALAPCYSNNGKRATKKCSLALFSENDHDELVNKMK